MRGHLMILYVNAAIFALIALASLGYGLLIHRSANQCIENQGTDCWRIRESANATYRFAPFLLGVGVVLAGIGWWLQTRPASSPSPPEEDLPNEPPPPEPPPSTEPPPSG